MIGFSVCVRVWYFIKIMLLSRLLLALSFLFLSLRLVCVLVFSSVHCTILHFSTFLVCREYKLLTLLHSIDPTNYLFTNWFFTFFFCFIFLRRRVCVSFLGNYFQNCFILSNFRPSHTERGLSLKYITLNLFTHNSLLGSRQ